MKNSKYWQDRMVQLEINALKKGEEYYKNLQKQYDAAIRSINDDIFKWYSRIADNNEISLSKAKKWLVKDELEEFKWTLQEYISYGKENGLNQLWMKELENASARYHINKLDAMKIQMRQHLEKLANEQEDGMEKSLTDIYEDTYYHTAYEIQKGLNAGYNIEKIDKNKIEKVLNTGWAEGKNFSDRIWTNKEKLVNSLNTELTQMIIRGEAPDKAIKAISATMGVSKRQAGRLVMTESAMIASVSQKECFNDLDVEEFEIVGTLDMVTCGTCGDLDGTHLPMKDFRVGETAPPFHVNCRCCTAPYFADDEGTRIMRDEEGKSQYIDSNIKYNEWKEKFVDNFYKMKYNEKKPQYKKNYNKQLRNYEDAQIKNISKDMDKIAEKYTYNKSKWSRRTIIDSIDGGYKDWNCDIRVSNRTSPSMILHEHIHAHSASYQSAKVYSKNANIEEATVQLLTQEICKKENIVVTSSKYDELVENLRNINKDLNIKNTDFEFVTDLIKQPIELRVDYLLDKLSDNEILDIEKKLQVQQNIEKLRGSDIIEN